MDIEHIRELISLMVDNDLSRVEIKEGDTHILLRRGQPLVTGGMPISALNAAHFAAGPATAAAPVVVSAPPEEGASSAASGSEVMIRSPMVGTFYSAADPDSPAFVKVGDRVSPDTVVCLIEAMKVFNEIKAEASGRVTRVLVSNGQAVEFDQPLFAVA